MVSTVVMGKFKFGKTESKFGSTNLKFGFRPFPKVVAGVCNILIDNKKSFKRKKHLKLSLGYQTGNKMVRLFFDDVKIWRFYPSVFENKNSVARN